jgi:hypothetical protein
MKLAESQKNMNIRIPTLLLNRIRVVALQKDVFSKDLVIQYLREGIEKEEKTVLESYYKGIRNAERAKPQV